MTRMSAQVFRSKVTDIQNNIDCAFDVEHRDKTHLKEIFAHIKTIRSSAIEPFLTLIYDLVKEDSDESESESEDKLPAKRSRTQIPPPRKPLTTILGNSPYLALQVIRNNPGYGKYMISRLHDKVMISPITVAMNCMLREIDSGSEVSLVTAIEMLAKTKKIDKTSTDTLYSAYLIGKHMFSRHGKPMSLHEMKIVAANHRSILISAGLARSRYVLISLILRSFRAVEIIGPYSLFIPGIISPHILTKMAENDFETVAEYLNKELDDQVKNCVSF